MSVLRVLVKNPVKKSFYGKKKTINILTVFLFPIKVMLKFSLTGFLTSALKTLVSINFLLFLMTRISWNKVLWTFYLTII